MQKNTDMIKIGNQKIFDIKRSLLTAKFTYKMDEVDDTLLADDTLVGDDEDTDDELADGLDMDTEEAE